MTRMTTTTNVNLIPTVRREAKRRRRRRAVCAVACGAYAALLACGLGAAHLLWDADVDGLPAGQRLAATEEDIRRLERQDGEARAKLAKTRATLEANRVVAEQPDWSVLLALLARTTGEDVVLQAVSVAPPLPGGAASTPAAASANTAKPLSDVVLELTGVGQSQLAVSRHVLRLEQTGLFAKVALIDSNRQPFLNNPAIAFRLQCTFGAGPSNPASAWADAGGTTR